MNPLAAMLDVEATGSDVFTATIPTGRFTRLFGGQVAGQALLAACWTLGDARSPHSLHAYFLRAGRPEVPVRYEVTRVRDGGSFSTRRVTATQGGQPIFELAASFQGAEPGADWQSDPPAHDGVPDASHRPPPERLAHLAGYLDIRRVAPERTDDWRLHPYWVRTTPPLGDHPALNAAALTYISDIAFMANAREPDTHRPMAMAASIDHALWFHRSPRVDDWLLFTAEPVANIGTRGLVRGAFHTEAGQLVATTVQEALLRPAGTP